MNESIVSCQKCSDYEQENVDNAVRKLIDNLGGMQKFVSAGQNVVLKPNLIGKFTEDKVATTNTAVVFAIANLCFEAGASTVTIADSPGGVFNKMFLTSVYKVTGYTKKFQDTKVILNENFESSMMKAKKADGVRSLEIIDVLQKADVIINICKLKTHALTGLSCSTKNMYGAIPGLVKAQTHANFARLADFCDLLVDLYDLLADKITLNVVDAIVGMEGAGPTAGKPHFVGALLASTNNFALDYTCLQIIGDNPETSPIIKAGYRKKRFEGPNNIKLIGEHIEKVKNYKLMKVSDDEIADNNLPKFLRKLGFFFLVRRPKIVRRKCVGCGKCKEHCPPKAISMKNGKAKIDYDKCIKCFCCQELCPMHVIKVKKPLIGRIISRK